MSTPNSVRVKADESDTKDDDVATFGETMRGRAGKPQNLFVITPTHVAVVRVVCVCVCVSWGVLCVMWVHRFLIIINNNSRNTFNFFLRSRRAQDAVGFCLVEGITGWVYECVWVLPVLVIFPALLAATSASMTLHLLPRRVVWHGKRFMKKLRLPPSQSPSPFLSPLSTYPLSAVEAALLGDCVAVLAKL